MRQWWSKVRALLGGRKAMVDDLRAEIEAHLEMEIEDHLAHGMSETEARRAFGNAALIQESVHEAWTFAPVENLAKDVMYAGRTLRKSPGFAAAAVLTLALGIGGITAMFTLIRTLLLKPPDYSDPDRLVTLLVSAPRPGQMDIGFNRIRYRELQAAPCFSAFAAAGIPETVTLYTAKGEPVPLREAHVSANFLDVLGVQPALGRGFLRGEDLTGGPDVALISHDLWKRLGGSRAIVGSAISLDAKPYTVAGVLPPHFAYPRPGFDVWVPRPWEWSEVAPNLWDRVPDLAVLARLRPQVTLNQSRAQLNVLSRQYALAHPGLPGADPHATVRVERLEDSLVRDRRPLLWMLFDAVAFVLLIVCANIAGLLLARSAGRLREYSVRCALGATRWRLTQQMLAESLSLALIGGLLGIPLANAILAALLRFGPIDQPQAYAIRVDGAVLAFTAAVSLAAGLAFGLLPSLRFSRPDLAGFLREQGALAGHAARPRRFLAWGGRGLLVVAQVAFSVVLLVGACLMLESFVRLRDVEPGFQAVHRLTMQIALAPARYGTNHMKQAFWNELVERVRSIPGVLDAAVARSLPTTVSDEVMVRPADKSPEDRRDRPLADAQSITPDYFRAFGIPLVRGRGFSPQDSDGAPLVAVINETLARRFWPAYPGGEDPIGRILLLGGKGTPLEIVGIAADVHQDGLASGIQPEVYAPATQYPPQTAYLVVRTAGPSLDLAKAVRGQVTATDPSLSVSQIQSMSQALSATLGSRRLTLILLGAFALMAVLITVMGIYGVIAFLVVERTQEFGIRQALGACRLEIQRLVVGRGLRLILGGLIIGVPAAAALTRLMRASLFHVSATDPWTYGGVCVLFLAVGLAACYLPARRATRMDPSAALR